jgi:hypothetical protein
MALDLLMREKTPARGCTNKSLFAPSDQDCLLISLALGL